MATKKKTSKSATGYKTYVNQDKWRVGHLHLIDDLPAADKALGAAISTFGNHVDSNRQSRHWVRAVQWIENILFTLGRHYIDDILVSRLARDTNNDLSVVNETSKMIPRPVNDFMGRYIETNIALLTENRPRPRVSAKSDKAEDEDAAKLSELTLEYLWEALNMPEKHREIARLILHCGVCWMELAWDPTIPRRISIPRTETFPETQITIAGGGTVTVPLPSERIVRDERGEPIFNETVEYGDISARVISPFEMHLPTSHWWNEDTPWVMREWYTPKDTLVDQYGGTDARKKGLTKKNGWHVDRLEDVGTYNIKNLPLWWWERLSDIVEGPGPSIYVGTPEQWDNYTVARWFDRKPNSKWPKGRSILIAGDQVIYDSPKEVGARAYDPRWPNRWHPYVRFRWEPITGSVYGRSLASKLLPKIKRVNAIDTTMIMYQRTVPIAAWIAPKGAHPTEDIWFGKPGGVWEYDPRRTANQVPQPVFPPDYPKSILDQRQNMVLEMESIAGTEEILKGERPVGTTSGHMLEVLRKQALASRSSILQAWEESIESEGSHLLQEVIKHIKDDSRYAERIRVLAREKHLSHLSVRSFSGLDISDNVVVRVDIVNQAITSKEAREAKALEAMQFAPGLMQLPQPLRLALLKEFGWDKSLTPQGPDVNRAKRMMAWIRQGDLGRIVPLPEDDPYVFYNIFVEALKAEEFVDLDPQQQQMVFALIDVYKQQIELREMQMAKIMAMRAQAGMDPNQES